MKNRDRYIDIARGLAIIFIVFGHTIVYSPNISWVYKMLYSFHVALFFIISGYVFKIKEGETIKSFSIKRAKRLLIPYFVWEILFIIPYLLFGDYLSIKSTKGTNYLFEILFNIFYANGANGGLKQNTALWFLPALFTTELFGFFIIKKCHSKKNALMIMITWIVLGFLYNTFIKLYLPFELNVVLEYGVFFFLGYLMKEYKIITKNKFNNLYLLIILTIFGLASCYLNYKNVSVVDSSYGYYLLSIISGFTLSYSIIIICYYFKKNTLLEYIGRNTLSILIFHKLIIVLFQGKIALVNNMLTKYSPTVNIIIGLIITSISILFSLVLNTLLLKVSPALLGKKE